MKDTARTVLTEAGINVDTALKRFLDDEEMYFEFLKSKYLMFSLCFGTKKNLGIIKFLFYVSCFAKIFSHREAICSLFDFISKDNIEVN